MKNSKIILVLFLLATAIFRYSYSQVSPNFQKLELKNKILSQDLSNKFEEKIKSNINLSNELSTDNKKSPYLGALFSSIIPGSGEFYAKRYVKAAIFLAIEAGLWVAYAVYENNGNTQTDNYEAFANQNWDVYQYAGWLKDLAFEGSAGIDLTAPPNVLLAQINACESNPQNNFSHQLPAYGTQQYYELIGKYQTFVSGWKDADLDYLTQNRHNFETYRSPMFTSYSYDRQQANEYYDNASTTLTLIIFNHVISAADAAWSVTMFNKDLKVKTGVHLEKQYSFYGERKLIPVANVNVTF